MPVVGELALGAASSLVFESLKRPLDSITAEIRRRDQVGRALSDRPSSKSAKEAALLETVSNDLARIIGSGLGKLTEPVSEFLRELQRTAIPQTLAHAALCGSSPEALREPFRAYHAQFEGLPFSSDQLLNGLYEACRARVELVQDLAMLEIIRAQHADLVSKVEGIAQSMAASRSDMKGYSLAEIRDARLRIARVIDADNRFVFVETLQGAKKFRLKSLSIPARLSALSDSDVAAAKIPPHASTANYLTFRRQFERAVILGDPGGGKSTLTQMILADQSALVLLEASNPGRKEFEQRDLRLPLRIILRQFEARQTRNPAYSFHDHLRDDIRVALEGDDGLASAYLSASLGAGEALVIFDGLDEVLDVGARRRMVEQIEQFSQIYAGCPVLVTSRLVGYRDAPLSDDFAKYGLARFNAEEISKYAHQSIAAVGQVRSAEAKVRAADFVMQSARVGGDIRENPLMLGLMVQIFVYRGDVPGNRPEVYKECATLMFEKWDGRRDIVADVPRHDVELLDVFGYVASRTFGNAESEEGVSREWLVSELRKHFEDWYVDKASAHRAAKSLVEFLTGRAWVMSEVGQGTYKFTHRTFLEYFFARNLISESRGVDELLSIDLIPHVVENQWSVISHLALHMAVFRDGGKSRQAAETLVRMLGDLTLPAAQELAFLRFVSSALSYLVISESAYLKIVSTCVARAISLGSREDVSALSVIEYISSTAEQRSDLAHREIEDQLSAAVKGESVPEVLFAMYAIGVRANGINRASHVDLPNNGGKLWNKLGPLRSANKKYLHAYASKNVHVARAYVNVYNECREEFYIKHGADFIAASASPLVPAAVDDLLFDALMIASEASARSKSNDFEDACALVHLVTQEVIGDRLNLSRLLSPGRVRASSQEDFLDALFRRLYMETRSQRPKTLDEFKASRLICILSASESLREGMSGDAKHARRHRFWPAPAGVIADMVLRVQQPEARGWLDRWVETFLREELEEERRHRSKLVARATAGAKA